MKHGLLLEGGGGGGEVYLQVVVRRRGRTVEGTARVRLLLLEQGAMLVLSEVGGIHKHRLLLLLMVLLLQLLRPLHHGHLLLLGRRRLRHRRRHLHLSGELLVGSRLQATCRRSRHHQSVALQIHLL